MEALQARRAPARPGFADTRGANHAEAPVPAGGMNARDLADMVTRPSPYVETVETHTATLFFTGDHVYKLEKPVDLGFLAPGERTATHSRSSPEVAHCARIRVRPDTGMCRPGRM